MQEKKLPFELRFVYPASLKSEPIIPRSPRNTFIWLTSRLRQAERGRQSAELDNRLFKQDFGDKINSLQLEVEALTRQR